MAGGPNGGWIAYAYDPSMAAAIIFIILFLIVTVLHIYQLVRTRTWFFIPMAIGGVFETIGYIGRAASAKESPNWTTGPYIVQSTLLLIAPALFAASIYMELGRIIILIHGQKHSVIRVNWLTKIFVAGDVLSFLMQASGAGLMVKSKSATDKTGENVILGGLFAQVLFFCLFVLTAFLFQRRVTKQPTANSDAAYVPWRKHMNALYISSALILVRSIVRVVEYIQGQDGYILEHEVFLYIFDAALMFLALAIFIPIHPSEINCLLGKGEKMVTKGGLSISEFAVAT